MEACEWPIVCETHAVPEVVCCIDRHPRQVGRGKGMPMGLGHGDDPSPARTLTCVESSQEDHSILGSLLGYRWVYLDLFSSVSPDSNRQASKEHTPMFRVGLTPRPGPLWLPLE